MLKVKDLIIGELYEIEYDRVNYIVRVLNLDHTFSYRGHGIVIMVGSCKINDSIYSIGSYFTISDNTDIIHRKL